MSSPIINQINTAFVHVSDLKKSVKWYSDLIGHDYDLNEVQDPVYNLKMSHHTGLVLDAGPAGEVKEDNPSKYPLFNLHTDDIQKSFEFIKQLNYVVESDIVHFDDFSFFTIFDPDKNIIMICTG